LATSVIVHLFDFAILHKSLLNTEQYSVALMQLDHLHKLYRFTPFDSEYKLILVNISPSSGNQLATSLVDNYKHWKLRWIN